MSNDPATVEHVGVVCAGCGLRFGRPLALLQTVNTVACPSCGATIGVRRFKAQAAAAALFERLTGFAGGSKGS